MHASNDERLRAHGIRPGPAYPLVRFVVVAIAIAIVVIVFAP